MSLFEVRDDLSPAEWDALLAATGGHPLQSALWGDARRETYGIEDERLALYQGDQLQCMLRYEKRGFGPFKKLAWAPQSSVDLVSDPLKYQQVQSILRRKGMMLIASTPWAKGNSDTRKTVWIDLSIGKEQLWVYLDKQWRYGVNRARREGIVVEQTISSSEVLSFHCLCQQLSERKQFDFKDTKAFLTALLEGDTSGGVSAHLFLAKVGRKLAGGALILRSGDHIHYLHGAVDRTYSKQRPGEAIHWAVMEWACEQGITLYDLEGIDPDKNPGVTAFKLKMGGEVVSLADQAVSSLSLNGALFKPMLERMI